MVEEISEDQKIEGNKLISEYMGVAYRKWHSEYSLLKAAVDRYSPKHIWMGNHLETWQWLVSKLTVGDVKKLKIKTNGTTTETKKRLG